jgi:cytochrome c
MKRYVLALILGCALMAASAVAVDPYLGSAEQREAGRVLYDRFCVECHGVDGDGKGPAAIRFKPRPRDFTSGKYKIRSTPSGYMPTLDDLKNIIRDGMPYTSMPPWPQLSDEELTELAFYLISFSKKFSDPEYLSESMTFTEPPAFSAESAKLGSEVYVKIGCAKCHGVHARGDGTSAPALKDDWGDFTKMPDMTKRWVYRGGPSRLEIYRAFTTALNGTPMPTYDESLSEAERWELTDYIWSLSSGDEPDYSELLVASEVRREFDLEQSADLFKDATVSRFPVVGQVIEPGREFFPSANLIEVRAVYNDSEIAFELRWSDMRAETIGTNSPAAEVPRFEDDPFRGGPSAEAGEEEDEDDFWGEEFDEEEEVIDGLSPGPTTDFSDAVAIQFPSDMRNGRRLPYFLFGDGQHSVDIWFMDLARQRPEFFIGHGSQALDSYGMSELSAVATFENGEWRVVFKRPLRFGGIRFEVDRFLPISFSTWDGFNRERGNKRGVTRWFYLYLEPDGETSIAGPVAGTVLATFGLELLLIIFIRRRHKGRA